MKLVYGSPKTPCSVSNCGKLLLNSDGDTVDLRGASLSRIAKCVNACAGMDDPVMEVQRLKNKVSAAMLEPSVSEKIESLYTSSPENLQKAIQEAKEDGFKFEFNSLMVYAHKPETPPSWRELGILPPVGTECEINEPSMSYGGRKVHVFAHYNGRAFAWDEIEESAYHSDNPSEFRPIQTEKQKTIKAMLECFDGFFGQIIVDTAETVCEKIYDKFIAKK